MPNAAKTYPAPWQGQLLLACKKCQKRLKKDGGPKALANLKKTLKKREDLHVLPMSCVDLCPKKGVVICLPAEAPDRLQILWSEEDLKLLSSPRELGGTPNMLIENELRPKK